MPNPPAPVPQTIADRTVPKPKGVVVEYGAGPVWLSMETCRCGHSIARPGVGYSHPDGWQCKQCGEIHTAFTPEAEYERDQKARITQHKATLP